jgi:Domain of unknown function (DUF222)
MCTSGGGVVDRVAGLAAAVASVAELDAASLPASAQLDLLRSVWPVLCQLDAAVTRVVGVVNAQGSAAQEGAVSTAAWLRSRLRAGGAGPRVQVAKTLREDLPEVAAAFGRGDISFTHARIAATTAKDLDRQLLAGGVDKLLAEQATEHAPAVFGRAALRIREHFNPDAAGKRRDRHPELDQWLDVDRTFHGAVSLSGLLAPDTGELLLQTLGAFMPPVNPDHPGPDHPGPDRLLPATTRRAEALAQMCRVAAGAAPDTGGAKPQVTVTIDWDTLRSQPDRAHTASQQTSSGPASSDTAGNDQTNNGNTGGPPAAGTPPATTPAAVRQAACSPPPGRGPAPGSAPAPPCTPTPPAAWPATARSCPSCWDRRRSRWTWAGCTGWSPPPSAAPSTFGTADAASPPVTARSRGATHITWSRGSRVDRPVWTT